MVPLIFGTPPLWLANFQGSLPLTPSMYQSLKSLGFRDLGFRLWGLPLRASENFLLCAAKKQPHARGIFEVHWKLLKLTYTGILQAF